MKVLPPDTLRSRIGVCVALFVGTLLIFARAWQHDFVNYDDPGYVTSNSHVKAGLSSAGVVWALRSGEMSNWHPVTWISHQLDATLFGDRPHGHHATSVLWHALTAVLAFLAVRKLTGALWTSAWFAALFAWHPLRVESVAWVAERKDVLSGFFWFLVLWAYAVYVERRRRGLGAGRFYALALGALTLGLMTKPMLVTLPCVLLLLDFWPLRRWDTEKPAALVFEKVPFFALAAISSYVTYVMQKAGGAMSSALSVPDRLANAVVAVVRYLGKFLWPFDLAVLYPHPGELPALTVIVSLVIVVGLTAAAWVFRRRHPWVIIGWLWFLGTLVPVIGLVHVGLQSMADRYTYLPILGVQLAGLWAVRAMVVSPRARRAWTVVGVLVLLGCAARTWDQLGVWKNSFTLFDHAIAVTEDNYLAHNNRGIYLCEVGRVDEGIADYRRALAIRPDYPEANNNLARILVQEGRATEAVPLLRKAVAGKPGSLDMRNNLATALSESNELDEAIEHYQYILQRQPRHANALQGLGIALAIKGRPDEGKKRLEEAVRLDPGNADGYGNLGNVCSMLGLRDEAIGHYRRATELDPRDAQSFFLIGALLNQQGKNAEAADPLRRAVQIAPQHVEAHAQLGLAYAQLGRREEAIAALKAALQLQPNHAQAKGWLEAVAAGLPTGKSDPNSNTLP